MSGFVKRLMATGAALTLGLSSVAFADYNYNCCPPVCDPCASWCDNLSVNAAWLYWKPSGDELDYAVSRKSFFPDECCESNITGLAKEKRHDVTGDWNSGYRLGLCANLPCKGWGVNVQWTHWDNSSSSHVAIVGDDDTRAFTSVAFPFFFYGNTTLEDSDESAFFRGKLNLGYNVVDIEMGKWLCCGDGGVLLRPHFGVRLADIKEKFHDEVVFRGTSLRGFSNVAYHHHNEFKGAGLRAGLDADYKLCDGWSIIGKGAASAVWGTTHNKHTIELGVNEIEREFILVSHDNYHHVRYFADFSLGMQWKTNACGCYPLTLDFAWEFQYLFGQHRPWSDNQWDDDEDANTSFKKHGDIALQGFTLNIAFDF